MSAPRRDPEVDAVPFGAGLLAHHRRLRRAHVLNGSAAAVWLACDGRRDDAAVVAAIGAQVGPVPGLDDDVRAALDHLRSDHLLVDGDAPVADGVEAPGDPRPAPSSASTTTGPVHRVSALGRRAEITCADPDVADRLAPLLAGLSDEDPTPGPVHRYELVRTDDPADGTTARLVLRHDGEDLRTGSATAMAHHLLWHLNHAAVEHHDRLLLLHAGAVAGPAGAVVVVGAPDAGKSTLTAGAVQAGLAYLTDEAPPIERAADGLLVHPYPKPLALDRTSRDLLGLGDGAVDATEDLGHVAPGALGRVGEGPTRVAAVVLPDLEAPSGPARRVDPADAALRLAEQAFNLPATGVEGLATLAALAVEVPVLALPSRDLPGAVATVLGLAGAVAPELHP